jgi:lysophospholipid acyltransferase (LPLAT)-like uncharacterized protein
MGAIKSITRSMMAQQIICWGAAQYIRFVGWSGRWQILGADLPEGLVEQGRPFIVAFWHGRLLMMSRSWRYPERVHVLISAHRDGQLISRTIAHFGSKIVVGSKRRGGVGAAREITRLLKGGEVVAVTPDGPRGPRMRVSEGIIALAILGDVPIIPLTYACRPRKIFSSWDRFNLPLPFCRGVFIWGEAIEIPKGADDRIKEAKRLHLECALHEITNTADTMLGQALTDPAPEPGSEPAPPVAGQQATNTGRQGTNK